MSEINPLTTYDLELAMEATSNLIDAGAMEKILSMKSDNTDKMAAGMEVFSLLNRHAKEAMVEVLANVRGETVEEFRQAPASEAVNTLNAVWNDERNQAFFTLLAGMFSEHTEKN